MDIRLILYSLWLRQIRATLKVKKWTTVRPVRGGTKSLTPAARKILVRRYTL